MQGVLRTGVDEEWRCCEAARVLLIESSGDVAAMCGPERWDGCRKRQSRAGAEDYQTTTTRCNAGRRSCAIVAYSRAAGSTICGRRIVWFQRWVLADVCLRCCGHTGINVGPSLPTGREQLGVGPCSESCHSIPWYLSDRFIRQTYQSPRFLCRSAVMTLCLP